MLRNATLCEPSRFFVKSLSCPFALSVFDRSIKEICGIERNENNGRCLKNGQENLDCRFSVCCCGLFYALFLFFSPPAVSWCLVANVSGVISCRTGDSGCCVNVSCSASRFYHLRSAQRHVLLTAQDVAGFAPVSLATVRCSSDWVGIKQAPPPPAATATAAAIMCS